MANFECLPCIEPGMVEKVAPLSGSHYRLRHGGSWERVIYGMLSLLLLLFQDVHKVGPRERSPSLKNVAVGQAQLGPAIQVSVTESAMVTPHRRVPVYLITSYPQPGKFMRNCVIALVAVCVE